MLGPFCCFLLKLNLAVRLEQLLLFQSLILSLQLSFQLMLQNSVGFFTKIACDKVLIKFEE
jgi:hypothetical protein